MSSDDLEKKKFKKLKAKFKFRQDRNKEELEAVINTPGGAYLMWRILSECGIYTASPDDPHMMAIHEGKRRVGQWLLAELIRVDEKLYTKVRNIGSYRDRDEGET